MCQHLLKNFYDMKDETAKLRISNLGNSSLSIVLLVLLFRAVRLLLHVFVVDIERFLDLASEGIVIIDPGVTLAHE